MKRSNRKLLSTLLLLSLVLVTFTSSIQAVPIAVPFSKRCENLPVATSPDVTPAQVGLAMTPEPMTSISINWTTIDTNLSNPIVYVWKKADKQTHAVEYKANVETRLVNNSTLLDGDNLAVTEKNFYSVVIDGLKADTKYEYRCGTNEAMSAIKSFTTAPDKNGKYTFIYVSDSQIRDEHAKSWQANLDMAKKMYPQASFMYIAGDLTNTAANENDGRRFSTNPAIRSITSSSVEA